NSRRGASTRRELFSHSCRRAAGIPIALQSCMRTYLAPLALMGTLLASTTSIAGAPTPDPGPAIHLPYSGASHRPHGQVDGADGSFMTPKPADLTRLAEKHGGTFPFQQVMAYIDGTQDVRAHGDPVMPVWGEEFRAQAGWDMGRRVEVQGKLLLITSYVRSL